MKIARAETHLITRAGASQLATTYGPPPTVREHVLVKLTSEDGVGGWGEATPLPRFTGETAQSIRLILESKLLPALMELDSVNITTAHRAMDAALYANTAAKAAVDMALHDLLARALGVPEYELLGGKCRDQVPLNRHIGIASTEESVRLAKEYINEGYSNLKIKVGVSPDDDIHRIRAIREAVGENIGLRVDANQGYDYPTALRVLDALRDVGLQYLEQPLHREDKEGLIRLRRVSKVPIGLDESLFSLRDAVCFAQNGCADVFVMKLIKTGGLEPARTIARVAHTYGIGSVVTSVFDTQLGAAHCLHLAAALPDTMSCDLTCYASQPAMACTCHRVEQGALLVGDQPGCGVGALEELELQ